MKWENVKERVALEVYAAVLRGGQYGVGAGKPCEAAVAAMFNAIAERIPFHESAKQLAGQAFDRVMAWDVRMVGKLRELFPGYFPKSLSKGKLIAEYDDAGDWVVLRA